MYRRFIKTLSLVLSCVMVICNIQVTHIHAEEQYQHSETETSGSVTMKVEWNDPVLGQPTTFHVSATGGSGAYKFRMDAPSYTNPNEMAYESVADPSRGEWMNYTNECNSTDYSFTMTASGTYNFRFYLMDKAAGVYYLRVSTYIQVSDSNHPSVRSIVQSAVAQCNNETDGSDYQKALWLHDWLLNQLKYDNTLKWSSAESALTRGLGTCQAYESAYSMLLSAAGIENAESRDTGDAHTWNAIKLDGEWYQVDCTWDDSSDHWYDFDQRRLYFGLTDELMAVAHPKFSEVYSKSDYRTPSTSLKNNYFVKSGEAKQWAESYRDRIQNSLNSKQTQFSIQADNSTYPPSIYKIQNGIIAYVMNQNEWFLNGKKVTLVVTVNDNKFDFTVTYPIECTKHDWDQGKVTTEPTCTKEGIKTYTCKNCATTKIETIKSLGHDYSNEWTVDKEATCTQEGSKSHHCTRCDDKKDVTVIPKLNHNWDSGVETTKATCAKDGVKTYTCKDCKTTKTETINALGHNYSNDWTIDKAATCQEEGSKSHHCTRCDDKKDVTVIPKLNHNWDSGVETTKATCAKDGVKTYTCKDCKTTKTETINALGHNYSNDWTIDKAATCQEEGSKSHHCTRCDDKKDVTVIPKLNHNWGSGVETTKATCIKDGIKIYTCKDCKMTKTETIKALGHGYSNDWTVDKAATCTQEGSKSHHCTRCGAKKDITVIPKTAHNWTGWSVVEQATTKKEGKERRTCRTCNLKEERSIAKLKVETQSMYRLYNSNSGEHFYTANAGEKNHLANIGWIYEGVGWNAPKTSDYPVYRLYNGNGGEHHYTMNKAEKDMLVRAGWKYEGIGWYSADPKDSNSIPLLREYNPNAFANNHNYTTSKPEHNWLISLGWKDEGKAWYALN